MVTRGTQLVTDGSVAHGKEALAGFWIADVVDEARAIAIAGRISAVADAPIEVRPAWTHHRPTYRSGPVPAGQRRPIRRANR